jgi:hypothetical protein
MYKILEISGFHSGVDEDRNPLACNAVSIRANSPMFKTVFRVDDFSNSRTLKMEVKRCFIKALPN